MSLTEGLGKRRLRIDMSFKNGWYKERKTKHPNPYNHPVFKKASPRLQFIWQTAHTKGVFRAGMLKRNVPKDKCETSADHTAAGFLTIVMFVGDSYSPEFRLFVFEMWAIHDSVAESGPFGDIPPGEVPWWRKSFLEHTWFRLVGERVPGWISLRLRFETYDAGKDPRAVVSKEHDKFEAIGYSVPMSWRFFGVVPEKFIERRAGYFTIQAYKDLYEEVKKVVAENPPRRMRERTWNRLAGPAKHPRPCDLPFFKKASPMLQFAWQASHVKHVYNPEFLGKGGIPVEKCETIGDHIAGGLSIIALLFGDECEPCKRLRIYELWAAMHLDEVIRKEIGPKLPEWGRFEAMFAELDEGTSEESRIVTQLKPFETALYAVMMSWHYPDLDPWQYLDRLEGRLTVPAFIELFEEAKALAAETRPRTV